jgi:hypothetical protein
VQENMKCGNIDKSAALHLKTLKLKKIKKLIQLEKMEKKETIFFG